MTPEKQARQQSDAQLAASGWAVQTRAKFNLSVAPGVGVCELSFATGEPDNTLFVDGNAIGTVETKPAGQPTSRTGKPEWQALAIPLPPLAEQTEIAAKVERRLSVLEELESVVSANLQRAVRLRQSILQKAFTGELV